MDSLSLATPQAGVAELERLCLPMCLSDLEHTLSFRRLHTLQCSIQGRDEKENENEALAVCSSIFSRPLPHLRHLYLDDVPFLGWDGQRRAHLLPVVPALISAHSAHLLTLHLSHEDHHGDGPGDAVDALRVRQAESLTAALLSCRSLRRVRVTDWCVSTSVHTLTHPALPCLESLHVDVLQRIDEAMLAVLLDEAPLLQELIFDGSPVTYDVLLWAGKRCPQQRCWELVGWTSRCVYPACGITTGRWNPFTTAPLLPRLRLLVLSAPPTPLPQSRPSHHSPACLPRPLRSRCGVPARCQPRLHVQAPLPAVHSALSNAVGSWWGGPVDGALVVLPVGLEGET